MRKKCILTVDDSTSVRHMVSQTLAEAGFDVLEAVDGLDALDALDKLEGDLTLILCDVNMPNMNGLEAVRRIRAHPAGKFIPIVMLTTESRKDIRDKGKLAGASGWITKPFDADDLLSIVRRFIR
jgi:two-component system, chemotaxis family, chemotaxis protein CheY